MDNIHLLRQLASEREAQLRRGTAVHRRVRSRSIRRRIGEELVRLGAWVAAEPMRTTETGAR
jgi:hypothetical protein